VSAEIYGIKEALKFLKAPKELIKKIQIQISSRVNQFKHIFLSSINPNGTNATLNIKTRAFFIKYIILCHHP
jgi:hypothetical protein